jgi:hypothetical protein
VPHAGLSGAPGTVAQPDSRLEGGGVNRRNMKFMNLNTHYKPGLALELNSSPGERGKNKSTKK